MRKLITYANMIVILVLSTNSCVASSGNGLPVADGGNADVTPANVEGELIKVTPTILVVAKNGTTETLEVELTDQTKYFTAFGGFVRKDELLPGQFVWVWFDERMPVERGTYSAAIVKVYSLDPEDKP